ncbi:hypothetical protein [Dyadobacter diqingensis]|uniref:hypothetical protein n=1 Tax=Dyadobacter diqingensis TaxID=2938121 RepID=UPI0020C1904D|nr:hypothetical protein [Dyadobacter diqingensis]
MDFSLLDINYKGPVATFITFALLASISVIILYLLYLTLTKTTFRKSDLHKDITLRITLLWALVVLLILLNILLGLLFFFAGWENIRFFSLGFLLGMLPFLIIYFGIAIAFWLIYIKLTVK